MPKRPKAKVKTTTTERKPSAAKQRRIDKQLRQEIENKENYPEFTSWEISKKIRHNRRVNAGKTYDNWRKTNSARAQERPTASNLLVAHTSDIDGRY